MNTRHVNPVAVSGVKPIYVNGRLKYWTVDVEYDADLRLPPQENLPDDFGWVDDDVLGKSGIVLNPVFNIKKTRRISFVKYNRDTNNTRLTYSWRDGLFGFGGERAWQFRLNIIAQINKNENIK